MALLLTAEFLIDVIVDFFLFIAVNDTAFATRGFVVAITLPICAGDV